MSRPNKRHDAIGLAVVDGAQNNRVRDEGTTRRVILDAERSHGLRRRSAPRAATRLERSARRSTSATRGARGAGRPSDSPSPDCGGRRSRSESVIVAISTRMITNTARPSPGRRPVSSSSGIPPARLGSTTGLAASRPRPPRSRVDRAIEQAERLRVLDADGLRVRANEAANENVCGQTRKRSRFEKLERGARHLRGCRYVAQWSAPDLLGRGEGSFQSARHPWSGDSPELVLSTSFL